MIMDCQHEPFIGPSGRRWPCPQCAAERDAAPKPDLERFARKMFELSGWPDGGDIDCGDLQRVAVECGLLIPETRTEPCAEGCFCEGYYAPDEFADGITCYRKAAVLADGGGNG